MKAYKFCLYLSLLIISCSFLAKNKTTFTSNEQKFIDELELYKVIFKDFLIANKFCSKHEKIDVGISSLIDYYYMSDDDNISIDSIYKNFRNKTSRLDFALKDCNKLKMSKYYENIISIDTLKDLNDKLLIVCDENFNHIYYKTMFKFLEINHSSFIEEILNDRKDYGLGIDIKRLMSLYFYREKRLNNIDFDNKLVVYLLIFEYFIPEIIINCS